MLVTFIIDKCQYIKYEEVINGVSLQLLHLDIPNYLFFPIYTPFKVGSENVFILENIEYIRSNNRFVSHALQLGRL